MSIAVKINTQNQQKVRTLTPIAISSSTLVSLLDVSIVDLSNNSTLVYNTTTSKYEIKALPLVYGGSF